MAETKKTDPVYSVKLEAVEAFVFVQLLNESTIRGAQAELIISLKKKLQSILDTHQEKTGEYVGYQQPNKNEVNGVPQQGA